MANSLSYPNIDYLVARYGNTTEGRKRARAEIAEAVRVNGKALIEETLRTAGRSMKCGAWSGYTEPRHAGTPDGCGNNGANCACECHDPVTT